MFITLSGCSKNEEGENSLFYDDIAVAKVKEGNTNKSYLINKEGLVIYAADEIGSLSKNGLISIRNGNKWGYIDKEGTEIIPVMYDSVTNFDDSGLAIVTKDGLSGVIDANNKIIVDLIYDSINNFSDGLARVELNSK